MHKDDVLAVSPAMCDFMENFDLQEMCPHKKIAFMAVDSKYPNLALMKISAWHKAQGDSVEWYLMCERYDRLYMSKIFSFTPDYGYYISNVEDIRKGGTGYDTTATLPEEIDRMQPDYSLYPDIPRNTAYGFLTRGCPNHCKWCIVPKKEGDIKPYMDIEEIAVDGRNHVILMDNNVLASDYGLQQIEKIVKMNLRVDFNQGLDARLVTPDIAKLLAKVKWMGCIRFGCDTPAQVDHCERAVELMQGYGFEGRFFFYCMLHGDIRECLQRIEHWGGRCFAEGKSRYVTFAQPFRDLDNPRHEIPQWQKDMARWANKRQIYRSCMFEDYEPRKGFLCREYFR